LDLEHFWFSEPLEKNWFKNMTNVVKGYKKFCWGERLVLVKEPGFTRTVPLPFFERRKNIILQGWEGRRPENQRREESFFPELLLPS
jgi:hypothetical protein